MKRTIILAVTVLLTALLQTTFCDFLSVASIKPNLPVILTASFALMCGRRSAALIGFCTGMALDLISAGTPGFYALIYTWVGYLTGYSYRIFYDDDIKTPLLLIGGADLMYGLYQYVSTFLIRGRIHFFFYLGRIMLPEMIYTIILAVPLYQLLYRMNRKLTVSYF